MACMEHVCKHPGCDWVEFDNVRHTTCPDHPGEAQHIFDEAGDDSFEDEYDDFYEDEFWDDKLSADDWERQ